MSKRETAKRAAATAAQLDKLIEEATVDCYDDDEQVSGFGTMVDENLAMLEGACLDFVSEGLKQAFQFDNPNAGHTCGCFTAR